MFRHSYARVVQVGEGNCLTSCSVMVVKLDRPVSHAMTYLYVWRSGTFPEKPQVSEHATDRKH